MPLPNLSWGGRSNGTDRRTRGAALIKVACGQVDHHEGYFAVLRGKPGADPTQLMSLKVARHPNRKPGIPWGASRRHKSASRGFLASLRQTHDHVFRGGAAAFLSINPEFAAVISLIEPIAALAKSAATGPRCPAWVSFSRDPHQQNFKVSEGPVR
jgi:hypothetical protein